MAGPGTFQGYRPAAAPPQLGDFARQLMQWFGQGAQKNWEGFGEALAAENRGAVLPIERNPESGAYSLAFPRASDLLNVQGSPFRAPVGALGSSSAFPAFSKGLDLSTEARMARAAEQGYTTPAWHSTRAPGGFEAFEPFPGARPPPQGVGGAGSGVDFGIHVGLDPETAHTALVPEFMRKEWEGLGPLGQRKLEKAYGESSTLPLRVNPGKILDMPDMGDWSSARRFEDKGLVYKGKPTDELLEYTENPKFAEELADLATRTKKDDEAWQKGFANLMKKHDYGAVRYMNYIEGGGKPSLMFVDPSRVRSVHAKFDPAKRGDPNLLSAKAPLSDVLTGVDAILNDKGLTKEEKETRANQFMKEQGWTKESLKRNYEYVRRNVT